jgi:Domain of unknown function (DUF6285)
VTQDRPDAPDLLEAVAEYLFSELRPAVPDGERFRVLVAANVCAVVARELRAGDAPSREDLALLLELLGEGDAGADLGGEELTAAVREAEAKLTGRLRAGEFDDRLPELADRLSEHVRRKLQVARPDY